MFSYTDYFTTTVFIFGRISGTTRRKYYRYNNMQEALYVKNEFDHFRAFCFLYSIDAIIFDKLQSRGRRKGRFENCNKDTSKYTRGFNPIPPNTLPPHKRQRSYHFFYFFSIKNIQIHYHNLST